MRGSFELSNQLYLLAEFLNICQLDMLMDDSDKVVGPASVCAEARSGAAAAEARTEEVRASLRPRSGLRLGAEGRQMENLRRKTMSSCSGMGLPKK
jgi:hypothetical protein